MVRDNFNQPLPGVEVRVAGTQLKASTNGNGEYSLGYAPGKFSVIYAKSGYTDHSREFEVSESVEVPVDEVGLWKVPQNEGLSYMGSRDYITIESEAEPREIERLRGDGLGRVSTYVMIGHLSEVELIGEDGQYGGAVFLIPANEDVVLLRANKTNPSDNDASLFDFQPLYKLSEQQWVVPTRQANDVVPGYTLIFASLEVNQVYSLSTLGEESCGFLTCLRLTNPTYLFRAKWPD